MPIIGIPLTPPAYDSDAVSYTNGALIYKGFFEEIILTGSFEIPSGEDFTTVSVESSLEGFVFGTPEISSGGSYSFTVNYGALQSAGTITVTASWGDTEEYKIVVGTNSYLELVKSAFLNPTIKVERYELLGSIVRGALEYVRANCNKEFPDNFPCILMGGRAPVTDISSFVDGNLRLSILKGQSFDIELAPAGKTTGDLIAAEIQEKIRAEATETVTAYLADVEVVYNGVRYIINSNLIGSEVGIVVERSENYALNRALKLGQTFGAEVFYFSMLGERNSQLMVAASRLTSAMYALIGSEGFSSVSVGEVSYQTLADIDPILRQILSSHRRFF